MLSDLWLRLFGVSLDTRFALVVLTGVAALVVVAHRGLWRLSRNVVTIAHEGGHAVAAVLSGRRLAGIRLHSDTSGVTVSRGRPTGPGMVVTSMAGYLTPSLLGLGAALLVAGSHTRLLLWIGIGLLAAMLVMIRNAFGVVSVVATGAGLFAVSWYAPEPVRAGFCLALTWFLLIGGVRPVRELWTKRRRGRAPDSDADQLGRLTPLPAALWVGLFLVFNLALLVLGGRLLLL